MRRMFLERSREREPMKLRFLGSTSQDGECPTLYATDRGTYVVQGRELNDPEALAGLRDVLDGEAFVEIPRSLLRFAEADAQTWRDR
jgi:hypothetical protein